MGILSKLSSLFARKQQPSLSDAEAIVDQFVDLGFLKFTPEAKRTVVRQQLIESVRSNYLDSEWDDDCISADRRSYAADAEDLAEGGIGTCLRQMGTVLSEEGVVLEGVDDVFEDEHRRYKVIVNGDSHLIYDLNEFPVEETWLQSLRRLIEIVNSMLEQAGSDERLYGISGGNDARVVFLTKPMYEFIRRNAGVFDENWIPVPTSELI